MVIYGNTQTNRSKSKEFRVLEGAQDVSWKITLEPQCDEAWSLQQKASDAGRERPGVGKTGAHLRHSLSPRVGVGTARSPQVGSPRLASATLWPHGGRDSDAPWV